MKALSQCMEMPDLAQRRETWSVRRRRQRFVYSLKILTSLACHVSFTVFFLALPLKIVAAIGGFWPFYRWWHVPAAILAAVLLGACAQRLERWVLATFLSREFPPPQTDADGPTPFPRMSADTPCPACGANISGRALITGFHACHCGALLFARNGRIDVVQTDDPAPTPLHHE